MANNNPLEIGGAQALLLLGSKSEKVDDEDQDEDDFDTKENQQLNDAVEAAVMRYVGGSLDKRKRKHEEPNLNDFNQWTRFLDEDNMEDYYEMKKKKRSSVGEIDPELATLGSEHDQLVEAAILDARELTRETGNGYLVTPQQAQQVLAAANAAVQQGEAGEAQDEQQNSSAITQLAQAASSLLSKKEPPKEYNFDKLTDVETLITEASAPAISWFEVEGDPNTRGPRIFSIEEINAVEYFINGYCHLQKWSREDVCNRIWSNERKKDKFWESLTRVLPYRSRASIYKHVRRQYHVFEVRAKWTKEDDITLSKLATETECKWKTIGLLMQRMPEDCRDRWRNYVKCGENRSLQKWSSNEEDSLREIVNDMVRSKDGSGINWTIVSERMNGVRSRIQCRYKWTKLIKKESLARTEFMSPLIKSWLVKKLQVHHYQSIEDVDWSFIHDLYTEDFKGQLASEEYDWLASDFQASFERMKSGVKGHKKLSLVAIILSLLGQTEGHDLLDSNLGLENQLLLNLKKSEVKYRKSKSDLNDPNSIANAAVAAISSVEDATPQEYSLWR